MEFEEFIPFVRNDLTTEFIRFLSKFFTNGKGDPKHNPSIHSCLIRIPEPYNYKCLNRGLTKEEAKVKVLKKWNGKRLEVVSLVHEFRIWLTQQEINLTKTKRQKSILKKSVYDYSTKGDIEITNVTRIHWIEKLLQTPIEDHRKDCLWRIIAPYLLNIRDMFELEAAKLMENWLDKCDKLRKLNFEPKTKIFNIIRGNKGYKPISYEKLEEKISNLINL